MRLFRWMRMLLLCVVLLNLTGCTYGLEITVLPPDPAEAEQQATLPPTATVFPTATVTLPTATAHIPTATAEVEPLPAEISETLETVLAYLREKHPDLAPAADLVWRVVPDTPEELVGARHYRLEATDWSGRLIAPVVAPSATVYDVTLESSDGRQWVGRVNGEGTVQEMPSAAAGAREQTLYADNETGFTLRYDSSWQSEADVPIGGQTRDLVLSRDGWQVVLSRGLEQGVAAISSSRFELSQGLVRVANAGWMIEIPAPC